MNAAAMPRARWVAVRVFILLAAMAGFSAPEPAAAQASSCGVTELCRAPTITPWEYRVWAGGFRVFPTVGEAEAALRDAITESGQMCSLSEASRQQNVYIGTSGSYPVYDLGIEVLRSTQITYNYTQHTTDNCIGSGQTWGSYEHHREMKCEDGWSLLAPTAQHDAYCSKPIASEERPKEQGKPPYACCVGNPADLGSGNKVEVQTDYQGAGAFPLSFTRTYNSVDAYKNGSSTTLWAPFGDGWSATYFQRVELSEWGGLSTVRAYRPDGRLLAFNLSGSQYLSDADVAERLTKLVDGSGNPTGWALTTSDDTVERYDLNGRLTSITDCGRPSPL